MLYFPQLLSGAAAQYPFSKLRISRTILARLPGGATSKLSDPGGARVRWRLNFQGLTDAERAKLETFFESAEGRLKPFVFLDPTDNLLAWSEDPAAGVWVKGPLLEISMGVADPWDGSRAIRIHNAGNAEQSIDQTLAVPGWFRYCLSAYVRSDQPGLVRLRRTSSASNHSLPFETGSAWRRAAQGFEENNTDESTGFGIGLAGGATADVYGLQVEAQPGVSSYRRTLARSGVYPHARFEDDFLSMTADGPDGHSCALGVVAPLTS